MTAPVVVDDDLFMRSYTCQSYMRIEAVSKQNEYFLQTMNHVQVKCCWARRERFFYATTTTTATMYTLIPAHSFHPTTHSKPLPALDNSTFAINILNLSFPLPEDEGINVCVSEKSRRNQKSQQCRLLDTTHAEND